MPLILMNHRFLCGGGENERYILYPQIIYTLFASSKLLTQNNDENHSVYYLAYNKHNIIPGTYLTIVIYHNLNFKPLNHSLFQTESGV